MYIKRLRLTASGADNRESFTTIGERLFPGVSNPTGHLLDALKRGGR